MIKLCIISVPKLRVIKTSRLNPILAPQALIVSIVNVKNKTDSFMYAVVIKRYINRLNIIPSKANIAINK